LPVRAAGGPKPHSTAPCAYIRPFQWRRDRRALKRAIKRAFGGGGKEGKLRMKKLSSLLPQQRKTHSIGPNRFQMTCQSFLRHFWRRCSPVLTADTFTLSPSVSIDSSWVDFLPAGDVSTRGLPMR